MLQGLVGVFSSSINPEALGKHKLFTLRAVEGIKSLPCLVQVNICQSICNKSWFSIRRSSRRIK